MRPSRLTYRLLLPLLAGLSLLTFWKIDKVSFLHHYIRIIAEVEARNSQALEAAPDLISWDALADLQTPAPVQAPWLSPQEFPATTPSLLDRPRTARLLRSPSFPRSLPPIRAP